MDTPVLLRSVPHMEKGLGGFKGLHESIDAARRPLNQPSALSNLVLTPGSGLATRPGLTQVGAAIAANPVYGLHMYQAPNSSTVYLLAGADVNLKYSTGGAFTLISGTWPQFQLWTAANAYIGATHSACIFKGATGARKWDPTGGLQTLGGSPPAGWICKAAYTQLFVAGVTNNYNTLYFSDANNPELWAEAPTNVAGSIPVGSVDDGYITWLDFDPVQKLLVIWTLYGQFYLQGPETGNRPELWSVPSASHVGTPAGKTVKRVKDRWIWLTWNGFAMWTGSGEPVVVVDPIKTTFRAIDWTYAVLASAVVDDLGRYWCSFYKTGGARATVGYDPAYDAWYTSTVDVWQSAMVPVSGKLTPAVGDINGKVHLWSRADGTDNDTVIPWSAELGPSAYGDPFTASSLHRITPVMSLASGHTANAYVAVGESGSYGTAKALAAGTGLTRLPFPTPVVAGENNRGELIRVKLAGSGTVAISDMLQRAAKGGR